MPVNSLERVNICVVIALNYYAQHSSKKKRSSPEAIISFLKNISLTKSLLKANRFLPHGSRRGYIPSVMNQEALKISSDICCLVNNLTAP